MKKRMTILALLLAGAVTLGSYGMVQAGQEKREVPVADDGTGDGGRGSVGDGGDCGK